MRYMLPTGLVLEGTLEQVSRTAMALGYNPPMDKNVYHYSETKGEWVRITDMDTKYLVNCLRKLIQTKGSLDVIEDEHFYALLKEYHTRERK